MKTRKRKKGHVRGRGPREQAKRRFPVLPVALVGLCILAAASVILFLGRERGSSPPAESRDFQRLVGKWYRPDGGYVIEIRRVDAEGRIEAAYFNPRPIHVSRAEASRKDGRTQVFIELRDQGYPGSTYSLDYDLRLDVLRGQYLQAAMGRVFEVAFSRMGASGTAQ